MRFLIEKSIFDSPNEYDKIKDRRQRFDYINNFLNSLPNAQHLKKAKDIYIDSILENGHNDLTNKFIPFIRNIYFDVPKSIANLIKELVDKNKLNLKDSKVQKWLYSSDLYNRPEYDIDYTIKALTLASNPNLQKEDGVNKFSDKDLKIINFYKDGQLLSAEQIKDVLRKWQTKEFTSEDTPETVKIKEGAINALVALGVSKKEASDIVGKLYSKEDTPEKLTMKALQTLDKSKR